MDHSLDQLLNWLSGATAGRPPGGRTGTVRCDVVMPTGTATRYVVITEEGCSVAAAVAHQPNATISVTLQDLTRLALGDLEAAQAFLSGRLGVEEDILFAMAWVGRWGGRLGHSSHA
ncbi:MAG TPA: SCP2 sterol-binding domain-containing protein [Streptomyces sp.]|nr:SCP2 sterol-binding domain-containing protein [Streptomyces sp.]